VPLGVPGASSVSDFSGYHFQNGVGTYLTQDQSASQVTLELADLIHPLDPSWPAMQHHMKASSARALGDVFSFQPRPPQPPPPPPSPPVQTLPPRPSTPPPPAQSLNRSLADNLSAAMRVAGLGIPKTGKAPQRHKPVPKVGEEPQGDVQQQIESPPGLGRGGNCSSGIASLGSVFQ